jgi:hypothetical protein
LVFKIWNLVRIPMKQTIILVEHLGFQELEVALLLYTIVKMIWYLNTVE